MARIGRATCAGDRACEECAPTYSRRYCSIQWKRKLHRVLRTLPVQGIDGRLTVELGLRASAVG
jgi:hypothetical protein